MVGEEADFVCIVALVPDQPGKQTIIEWNKYNMKSRVAALATLAAISAASGAELQLGASAETFLEGMDVVTSYPKSAGTAGVTLTRETTSERPFLLRVTPPSRSEGEIARLEGLVSMQGDAKVGFNERRKEYFYRSIPLLPEQLLDKGGRGMLVEGNRRHVFLCVLMLCSPLPSVGWASADTPWLLVNPQLTGNPLNGMCCSGPRNVWAVGDNGTVASSTDSGITWELQSTPSNNILFSVSFFDDDHGAAVGGVYGRAYAIATANGGNTWTDISAGLPNARINAVHYAARGEASVCLSMGFCFRD